MDIQMKSNQTRYRKCFWGDKQHE